MTTRIAQGGSLALAATPGERSHYPSARLLGQLLPTIERRLDRIEDGIADITTGLQTLKGQLPERLHAPCVEWNAVNTEEERGRL